MEKRRQILEIIVAMVVIVYPTLPLITFTSEPQDAVVKAGDRFRLSCKTTTSLLNGNLITTWSHNGTWITDYQNKHFKLEANGSLVFLRFLSSDQGTYQCSAIVLIQNKNVDQILSRSATVITAYIGSSFLYTTKSIDAKIGSTVHLQCISPKSIPTSALFWQKEDKNISGFANYTMKLRVSSTLTLLNLSFNVVGRYRCCAYNPMLLDTIIKSDYIPVAIKADHNAPYFFLKPTFVVTTRFRKAQIHCRILGFPPPLISWFKDKIKLKNSTSHHILWNGSLSILSVQLSDVGRYMCSGTNRHGSIHSSAVPLIVAYIDYDFKEDPIDTVVILGQTFILNCRPPASYPANPKISWFMNFDKVTLDNRRMLFLNGSLSVTKTTTSDHGYYHCESKNKVTNEVRTSQKAFVNVLVSPSIHIHKSNISILFGDTLHLKCNATGIPIPNITIYKHNTDINGTKLLSYNGSLVIHSVNESTSGLYECVAENGAGYSAKYIIVDVLTRPVLDTSPVNITTTSDTTTVISCIFDGNPKPIVHWIFSDINNLDINISQSRKFEPTSAGLKINKISKLDEGWYTCIGTNKVGMESVGVFVHVLVPPESMIPHSPVTVNHTLDAKISCTAFGDPIVDIHWMKGNYMIQNSEKFQVSVNSKKIENLYHADSQLWINRTTLNDAGMYLCLSHNAVGNMSSSMQLIVQVPPRLLSFTLNSAFKLGEELTIRCVGFGIPPPVVILKHNDTVIYSEHRPRNHNVTLSLKLYYISSKHSGNYTCDVRNQLGLTTQDQNVIIKVLPYAPILKSILVLSQSSVQIIWQSNFDGYSPVQGYILHARAEKQNVWMKINLTILSQDRMCVVNNMEPFTSYYFRLRARNDVGLSNFSLVEQAKTLQGAPSNPVNISIPYKNSTSMKITWFPPEYANGIISFYEIVITSNKTSLTTSINITTQPKISEHVLTNLKPFTKYMIHIRAITGSELEWFYGNSSSLGPILTGEALPTTIIKSIHTINITTNAFMITFSTPPQENMNGMLLGYKVQLSFGVDTKIFTTNETNHFFDQLESFATYKIRVATFNSVGVGPYSSVLTVITKTGIPGKVRNVVVSPVNDSFVYVSWNEPIKKNGVIIGYQVTINNTVTLEILRFTSIKTNLVIGNLENNATYVIYVRATTSAGLGSVHDAVAFKTGIPSPTTTTVIVPVASANSSWLEREYMIVILAISVFAFLIIMILCAILISRYSCAKEKTKANTSAGWELNPYYDHNESMEKPPSRFTPPTIHFRDFREDFIWDDDSVDEGVDNSSIEPEYAVAKTPSKKYASVEPYQGHRVELSPLVKLKGLPRKRKESISDPTQSIDKLFVDVREPYVNVVDTLETDQNISDEEENLQRPPSLSNLDLIDALIESELVVHPKVDVQHSDDLFERLGDYESIDLNNFVL